MGDFGDAEYPTMVCVEAGHVAKPCTLPPGEKFTASQTIKANLWTTNGNDCTVVHGWCIGAAYKPYKLTRIYINKYLSSADQEFIGRVFLQISLIYSSSLYRIYIYINKVYIY